MKIRGRAAEFSLGKMGRCGENGSRHYENSQA
jgi:hypothetical protein